MSSNVIVLNADNTYIGSITWQQSIILIHKGKVEVLKSTDKIVRNITREFQYYVPRVVRLIKFIKNVYKTSNVPYSKRAVFIRDGYKCQYCGVQLEKKECTVDHIYPKALGGETSWENCCTACSSCNNLKGDIPYVGKTLVIKDGEGREHHLNLRKRPQRPTVGVFLRMKAMDVVWEDVE